MKERERETKEKICITKKKANREEKAKIQEIWFIQLAFLLNDKKHSNNFNWNFFPKSII